mmetsp:Transcript_1847/g.5864  ORF Transcript_1847/g.5864 Transcript_1847/m.5864 type:complete len:500 (-) Transcript_1847:84-1583(-)
MGGSCFEQLGEQPADGDPEHAELDNFWPICDMPQSKRRGRPGDGAFELDGKTWPTCEHFFQAAKFPKDPDYQETIRTSETCMGPEGCFSLGRNGSMSMSVRDWDSMKLEVMYRCNRAKYEQNPHLRRILCGIKKRIRAQGNADEWATWNEILLERIREELRDASERDETVLHLRVSLMDAFSEAVAGGDDLMRHGITKCAKRRELPATMNEQYTLSGYSRAEHEFIGDGMFRVDPREPELNGQPHLTDSTGSAHIYLGCKRGQFKWVIDEECSPKEVGGAITLEVAPDGPQDLPIGTVTWAAPWSETKEVVLSLELQSDARGHTAELPSRAAAPSAEEAPALKRTASDCTEDDVIAIFRAFDLNRDGFIDRQELGTLLRKVDPGTWSADRLDRIFAAVRTDRLGRISYEEFVSWAFRNHGEKSDELVGFRAVVPEVLAAVDKAPMPTTATPPAAGASGAPAPKTKAKAKAKAKARSPSPARSSSQPHSARQRSTSRGRS